MLTKPGVEIVSFSDREILTNIEGVYEIIKNAIEKKKGNPPHLNPGLLLSSIILLFMVVVVIAMRGVWGETNNSPNLWKNM
jgi:hypothetical protein